MSRIWPALMRLLLGIRKYGIVVVLFLLLSLVSTFLAETQVDLDQDMWPEESYLLPIFDGGKVGMIGINNDVYIKPIFENYWILPSRDSRWADNFQRKEYSKRGGISSGVILESTAEVWVFNARWPFAERKKERRFHLYDTEGHFHGVVSFDPKSWPLFQYGSGRTYVSDGSPIEIPLSDAQAVLETEKICDGQYRILVDDGASSVWRTYFLDAQYAQKSLVAVASNNHEVSGGFDDVRKKIFLNNCRLVIEELDCGKFLLSDGNEGVFFIKQGEASLSPVTQNMASNGAEGIDATCVFASDQFSAIYSQGNLSIYDENLTLIQEARIEVDWISDLRVLGSGRCVWIRVKTGGRMASLIVEDCEFKEISNVWHPLLKDVRPELYPLALQFAKVEGTVKIPLLVRPIVAGFPQISDWGDEHWSPFLVKNAVNGLEVYPDASLTQRRRQLRSIALNPSRRTAFVVTSTGEKLLIDTATGTVSELSVNVLYLSDFHEHPEARVVIDLSEHLDDTWLRGNGNLYRVTSNSSSYFCESYGGLDPIWVVVSIIENDTIERKIYCTSNGKWVDGEYLSLSGISEGCLQVITNSGQVEYLSPSGRWIWPRRE